MIIFPAGVGSVSSSSRDEFLDKHSLNFDGTDDYVSFDTFDGNDIIGTGDFTVSFWFKRTEISASETLLYIGESANNHDYFWLNLKDDGTLRAQFRVGSSGSFAINPTDYTTTINVWYNVLVTRTGQAVKLYLNGIEISSGSNVHVAANLGDTSSAMFAGRWRTGSGYVHGRIAQFGIWSRVLSSEEIQIVYDRPNNLGLNSNYKSYSSSGLVGYWPMLEGSGDTTIDRSIKTNNGTIYNNATWSYATPSKSILEPKYSINFDGTNNHIVTAFNTNDHNLRNGFTISTWVYLDDNSTTQDFFGRYGSSTARFYFGITGSKVRAAIGTSYDTSSLSHGMSTGKWHHVAYTFSGGSSGTFTFYLDGSSVGTITFTWTGDSGSNEDVHIGGLNNGGNDYQNPFNGKMTDLAFFSSTASATEISTIYNNGNLLDLSVDSGDYEFSSNLVAYWRMNEGTGTSTKDIIGVKNGTLTNSPTWSKIVPFKADNYSVYLDGSNDIIDLTTFDPSTEIGTGAFTMSMWMKAHSDANQIFWYMGNSGITTMMRMNYLASSGGFKIWANIGGSWTDQYPHVDITTETGVWYHVAVVRSGTTVTLYVNATNSDSKTHSSLATGFGTEHHIGKYMTSHYLNGNIGQYALWNEALTSSEIASIYNDGAPINVASNFQNYSSASNLVGYWDMNEGDGDSLTDSSSNSNTATLENGPTWSNDSWNTLTKQTRNYSIDFDGTNDYVPLVGSLSAGTYNFFTSTLKYSVSIWFQLDDHTANASQVLLANNYTSNSGANAGIQVWYDNRNGYATKAIRVNSWAGTSVSTNTANAISDNNWHHLVVTSSGASGTLAVYLDGASLATASLGSVTSTAPNQDLAIGGRVISSSVDSPINGKMKDVAIFNRALSSDAVKSIYNDGEVIDLTKDYGYYKPKNNLIAYYQMEEGEGTILMDRTGNGRNGTLTNGPTYSTSTP